MGHLQNIQQLNDLELIDAYRSTQDKSYVGILFQRYTHLVFGVCMKYLRDEDESKDAVMNIFEKLMKDLLKHEIKFFKGWLHTVSKNHCLMELRKKPKTINGQEYLFVENLGVTHQNGDSTNSAIEKEISLTKLEVSIEKLEPQQRICIELFYMKQLSYLEVATTTGFNLNQIKSFIQNGKRNLKNLIQHHD